LNTSNTISLKLNLSQSNIDSSVNLNSISNTSSQWITSGSNIYYNSGNVGIGTIPSQKLHIDAGCLYITGNISDPGNNTSVSLWNQSGIAPTFSGHQFVVQTNGTTERLRKDSSGIVASGTTNPKALLHVRGKSNNSNKWTLWKRWN